MSEHMPGEIWIGGAVPASEVSALCQAIAAAHVALDWGEAQFEPKTAEELLAACTDLGDAMVLHLYDDQARYGQFEELEAFLQLQGIPFDRRSDGKYEFDPLFVQYRPGAEIVEELTDHSGNPTIRTEPLYEVSKQLAEALSRLHQGATRQAQTALEAAYENLHEILPKPVPPLPSLTILSAAG